jgi:hypothetical protein
MWCAVAALSIVLLVSGPLFAQSTATFLLNSAGSGSNLGGVYTSPYTGEINGGTTIPVICDDFADDSYVPEQWAAYVTALSSVISGTDANTSELNWQNSAPTIDGTLSQVQAYSAAALLSIGILTSTGNAQEEYSFALWDLFDSQAFTTLNTDYGAGNGYEAAAQSFLNTAVGEATSGIVNGGGLNSYLNNYNVTIYSYDASANPAGPVGCGGHCSSPPQEFIAVSMAEPSSLAMLVVYLLVGGGSLLFFCRRQIFQSR